jgi:DMSO/TMAO reductase YedYZ molybdopterin-dependent catalytic subunit
VATFIIRRSTLGAFQCATRCNLQCRLPMPSIPRTCFYEMNGEPLPPDYGFPVRLIAPGWYGIANVKWLKRIELRDTRFMGPFMAQRYVTIREEPSPNGETHWTRISVSRSHVKSIPAKVTLRTAGTRCTVQRGVRLSRQSRFGSIRVLGRLLSSTRVSNTSSLGSSGISIGKIPRPVSTALRLVPGTAKGNIQPAMDDLQITKKRTYWDSNSQITRTVRI